MAAIWQGPKAQTWVPWSPQHHLHYINPMLQQQQQSQKRHQSLSSTSAPTLQTSCTSNQALAMKNPRVQDNDESYIFPSVKSQIRAKLHESLRQSIDNCSVKSDPF